MEPTLPWEEFKKHAKPSKEDKTPLIYFGGKTRAAEWVISHFPPHSVFVDVFGGGGGITFAKEPSEQNVYNDVGNVSSFFKVLRDRPDELYKALFFTPYSREEFEKCANSWEELASKGDYSVEWARRWYIAISQSYKHSEKDKSWLVSPTLSQTKAFANHVDSLPFIVEKIRRYITIERKDFVDIFRVYDSSSTLFYCDPPYTLDSRTNTLGYINEMDADSHMLLLDIVGNCLGQVVLSGYHNELYGKTLKPPKWRIYENTRKSGIKNSSQNAGTRTEVLWVKSHGTTIWNAAEEEGTPQANVARTQAKSNFEIPSFLRRR